MTLSVGLARIVNDPDAPIRTRQALGRLATPGLLVTDEGLTINTDGRIVLRLSSGLSEDTSGVSVKVKSGGGIVSGDDGIALDDPLGDITFTNITVNQNANITGDVNVAGAVNVIGAVSAPVINSGTITNTGDIASGTATIVGNASVGGTFTGVIINAGTLAVSGNASVAGTTTTLSLAVTGNAGIAGSMGCGTASVGGSLTAGSASVSGAMTVGGALTAGSSSISGNASVSGTLTVGSSITAANVNVSGAIQAGSATITGTLSAGSFNPASITTGDVTASGTIRTPNLIIGGGVQIRRALASYVTLTFAGPGNPAAEVHSVSFSLFGNITDLLVGSPVNGVAYGPGFGSWSFAMTGTGTAVCRAVIGPTGSFSVTITFLVLSLSLV